MVRARRRLRAQRSRPSPARSRDTALADIVQVIEDARRRSARAVNATMTAAYWLIGRRIVQEEQRGSRRAGYGEALIEQLARELSSMYGRGFGRTNLQQMRSFYLAYAEIRQTLSGEFDPPPIRQTLSGEFDPPPIRQTLSGEFGVPPPIRQTASGKSAALT